MKYTENEILKALNMIRDVCNEANDCNVCPLREKDNAGGCYITSDVPTNWTINNMQKDWRAFKN